MLNDNDFNLETDEVSLADLQKDVEPVEAEIISSVDDFEEMSLTVQKKNKEALANLRNKVMYSLDQKKLEEAQKIIRGMENIGDMFSDYEVISKVKENISGAMDLKFLAEAYSKLLDSQQKLMRLDSVDGSGNAKRISIGVQFEDDNGTKLQTMVKVGD